MGKPHHPRYVHHYRWAPLCKLSSVLVVVTTLLFWGSLSIGRTYLKLAQHTHQGGLLLPGFHLPEQLSLHHQAPTGPLALQQHDAAAPEQQQQQEQQQQAPPLPVVSDVPGYSGPPYILPKLIHQTVKDKSSMSCEVQDSIQSWIDMNPGYTHILYDDTDLLDFVKEHYPDLVSVYQALPTNIERTDTWRYLVLHKLGGVYADSDVKCMQPISTWNQERNFDAALMVGIAKRNMRTGDTREFNQFVMAAMPGHPVMAAMPMIIATNLAFSHLTGMPLKGSGRKADDQILMRTGPKAFTSSLHAYAQRVGAKWPVNSTQADHEGGVLFGSVRAMPKFVFGTGWDTLDHNMTCEEVKEKIRPEALICHQFFGTWKTRPEKQLQARTFTYGECLKRQQQDQKLQGQQQRQLQQQEQALEQEQEEEDDDGQGWDVVREARGTAAAGAHPSGLTYTAAERTPAQVSTQDLSYAVPASHEVQASTHSASTAAAGGPAAAARAFDLTYTIPERTPAQASSQAASYAASGATAAQARAAHDLSYAAAGGTPAQVGTQTLSYTAQASTRGLAYAVPEGGAAQASSTQAPPYAAAAQASTRDLAYAVPESTAAQQLSTQAQPYAGQASTQGLAYTTPAEGLPAHAGMQAPAYEASSHTEAASAYHAGAYNSGIAAASASSTGDDTAALAADGADGGAAAASGEAGSWRDTGAAAAASTQGGGADGDEDDIVERGGDTDSMAEADDSWDSEYIPQASRILAAGTASDLGFRGRSLQQLPRRSRLGVR
jgi:hypothetical protein